MRIRSFFYSSLIIGCSFLPLFLSGQSSAAAAKPSAAITGLTVSPLRNELSIAPGSVYSGHLTVLNTTKADMNIQMDAEEFSIVDEDYDYSFDPASKLVDWVRFDPAAFILKAGTSQDVTYSISVPIGAEPRGEYISLFATSLKNPSENGITSQERVASLLYISIEGDITRRGTLISLHTPWIIGKSSEWTSEVRDSGSTHFRSIDTVTLETVFGKEINIASESNLILPSTVRLVSGKVPTPIHAGIYKVKYVIGLGDNPAKTSVKYVVYAQPLDVIVFITLIIVAIIIVKLPNKRKRS